MSGAVVLTREMGCSHREFFRSLPGFMGERTYQISGNTVAIVEPGRRFEIRLSEQSERRVGGLRLPVTSVTFSFFGYGEEEIRRLMERFDTYYRRGGG